jgi:hypothetical protein
MSAQPSIVLKAWAQPAQTPRALLIDWELRPGYETGEVYVMRSPNGMPGTWTALNELPLPYNGVLIDTPPQDAGFADFHYRLVVTHEGRDYACPSFLAYDMLTRQEYADVRRMLSTQLQRWVLREGMRMWHYVIAPGHAGVVNTNLDPETFQQAGPACAAEAQVTHVSAPFGYLPPVLTIVKFTAGTSEQDAPDPEGLGRARSKATRLFTTPYPKPGANHVLVHPHSGERWAIGETVKAYRYRGLATLRYEVSAEALLPYDERHKLIPPPIPRDRL